MGVHSIPFGFVAPPGGSSEPSPSFGLRLGLGLGLVFLQPLPLGVGPLSRSSRGLRALLRLRTPRLELFQRVQLASSGTPGVGPILAHVSCDFLKPVVWPAEIIVGTRVSSFGRTSFKMDYAIAHASQPDELVATGEGVIVLVNYGTGEKIPVSEELKAAIQAL